MERSSNVESGRYVPHQELRQLAHTFQHLKQAHHENTSDAIRRQLEGKMDQIRLRFERMLQHMVPDEEERGSWRAVFYHAAEPPELPEPSGALIFRGRSDIGSEIEVRERSRDHCDVLVDGAVAMRLPEPVDEPVLRVDNLEYHEVFDASPDALAAVQAHTLDPDGEPPWEHAPELIADGIVDRDFALTPRGRRALATLRSG